MVKKLLPGAVTGIAIKGGHSGHGGNGQSRVVTSASGTSLSSLQLDSTEDSNM